MDANGQRVSQKPSTRCFFFLRRTRVKITRTRQRASQHQINELDKRRRKSNGASRECAVVIVSVAEEKFEFRGHVRT